MNRQIKRQNKVCAGCGARLGEAVLLVNAVSGPSGSFCGGRRCYLDALDRHIAQEALEGPQGRASEAPDAVAAPGAAIGPENASGQGRRSWALFEREGQ